MELTCFIPLKDQYNMSRLKINHAIRSPRMNERVKVFEHVCFNCIRRAVLFQFRYELVW